MSYIYPQYLHSFPTRRSSDLSITIGFKEIWAHKFRSLLTVMGIILGVASLVAMSALVQGMENGLRAALIEIGGVEKRSEEHTSELQSLAYLVCRLMLEKIK